MPFSLRSARTAAEDAFGAARKGLTFARTNYVERRQFRGESPEFKSAWTTAAFIGGWLRRDEAELLFELAASVASGQDIVEVGSYLGRSTAFIGLGAAPGRTVHAVDPMTSEQFLSNMEKVGIADKLERHTATSVDAAASYQGKPIGLLFVDAIHTERAVLEDGQIWSAHLAPGCTVAFDDVNRPNVMKAVRRLVADGVMPEFVGHVGKVGVCGDRDRLSTRVGAILRKI